MRITTLLLVLLSFAAGTAVAAERKPIAPPGLATIGPYTPGILTGEYLYVSGHIGAASDNIEAQTRTVLDHIKVVVEAGGLTMDHIVYTHLFLSDIRNYEAVNKVYATYFPGVKPARVTVGVLQLPRGAAVAINAVAVRDLAVKQSVNRPGPNPAASVPISEGIKTADRFFLSGTLGRDRETGEVPVDEADQVRVSFRRAKDTLKLAGVTPQSLVCLDIYHTKAINPETIDKVWKEEFGSRVKVPVSVIEVNRMALGTNIGVTGVAALSIQQVTFSGLCSSVGETLYCTADQFDRVIASVKKAGFQIDEASAVQVYLDDIADFDNLNAQYGSDFHHPRPARATVQPAADSSDRPPRYAIIFSHATARMLKR